MVEKSAIIINTWRACARGLQYSLCVCVCLEFADFNSSLYDKMNSISLVFLCFQLAEFDIIMPFVQEISFFSCLSCSFQSINGAQVAPYSTRGCDVFYITHTKAGSMARSSQRSGIMFSIELHSWRTFLSSL